MGLVSSLPRGVDIAGCARDASCSCSGGREALDRLFAASSSRSSEGFGAVRSRVESRTGKLPTSTRLHAAPYCLEDDYEVTDTVLGSGCGGDVLLARGRGAKASQTYAVKVLKKRKCAGPQDEAAQRSKLETEVEALLSIDHPHIVRLMDVYVSANSAHLVMERMEGGELFDRVRDCEGLPETEAADASHQMLLAVNHLHSLRIVHRDIKLENFVYEAMERKHLKLVDFGFSKIVKHLGVKLSKRVGTLHYLAPEVLRGCYNSQCDLWSLGVVVFTLLSGSMPFERADETDESVTRQITRGKYSTETEAWAKVSSEGKEFVRGLLDMDAACRLTAMCALEHSWMGGFSPLPRRSISNIAWGDRSCGVASYRLAEETTAASDWGNESTPLQHGLSEDFSDFCSIAEALREFGRASRFRRACQSMMTWALTSQERLQVRDHFLDMDLSRDGFIQLDELVEALECKAAISSDEACKIFVALDANGDARVNYAEFLAAMVTTRITIDHVHTKQAFDRFDVDRTGYITLENLSSILGDTYEGGNVESLLAECDYNGDGSIDLSEFRSFLGSGKADAEKDEAGEPCSGRSSTDGEEQLPLTLPGPCGVECSTRGLSPSQRMTHVC
eukprot:TRINITY_DN20111_c0_g1_i1.p1 TRINITY_DN20111_c0_g1~~TRINITY_DN20111_c0_g1_i1.p1  ORF type:complete len:619 (+),score=96.18 TRINITY_DN20111_c0_g1_i1:92-1948(+)